MAYNVHLLTALNGVQCALHAIAATHYPHTTCALCVHLRHRVLRATCVRCGVPCTLRVVWCTLYAACDVVCLNMCTQTFLPICGDLPDLPPLCARLRIRQHALHDLCRTIARRTERHRCRHCSYGDDYFRKLTTGHAMVCSIATSLVDMSYCCHQPSWHVLLPPA